MSEAFPFPPTSLASPESIDSSLLRVLMDTMPDRIYFKDLQSRFVRNNAAHARSLGAESAEECVGKTDFDFFSAEHAERAFRDEQEIIRTGRPLIAQLERLTMRDGRKTWASATKIPWRDSAGRIIGTFGLTRDVTATREAEERLTAERNLLRTIIDHLPSRLYVKDRDSRYVLNNQAHLAMLGALTQTDSIGRTTVDFFPGERGEQALADDRHVIESGAPVLNVEKSDFGPEGDEHWSLVTKVPLRDGHGEVIGLVGISHDITQRKQMEEELRQRSTEMETDLKMARQVQEAFLNRTYPVFPCGGDQLSTALQFAHRYIPATTLGGDFFTLLRLSDTRCGVLICDVMGHGVRAGLLTALVRGVVEEMGTRGNDPAHVLAEVNNSLMPIVEQTGQPVFATVFFGVIDLATNTLAYGNAGHPAPLVRHASSNTITRLAPADPEPAAGLLAAFQYTVHTCPFAARDIFLGYTDGLIEASDPHGIMFGEQRLETMLAGSRDLSVADINERLLRDVHSHCGRVMFDDDVCLVAIQAT